MTETVKALIDGDIVMYKALRAAEKEIEFSPANWFMFCDLDEAFDVFEDYTAHYVKTSGATSAVIALSDYENVNFRKQLNPEYKQSRVATRKPLGYREFTERVHRKYETRKLPELEADDAIGIFATNPNDEVRYVVVSEDKDLRQIPGWHLDIGEDKLRYITKEDGHTWFLTQALTGDAVDNYKGCPGVGPVKAVKILDGAVDADEQWQRVVETYEKNGMTVDDAIMQARMAKILQYEDYDMKAGKAKLWTPSK